MNPEQQKPQEPPLPQSATTKLEADTSSIAPQQAVKKSYKKLGLFFLLGPTALLLASLALYAIINLLASSSPSSGDSTELFETTTSPFVIVLNVILYIMGAVGVLTWLPGIIIGIILLNKKA